NPMPDLNTPATNIPLDTLDGLFDRVHSNRGQQHPLDGLDGLWGIDFNDLDGPQRHGRQALSLAMPRRRQRQGTKPQRQRGLTCAKPPVAGWMVQLTSVVSCTANTTGTCSRRL